MLPYNSHSRAPPAPPFYRNAFVTWIKALTQEDALQAVRRRQRRERKKRRLKGPGEKLHDLVLLVVLLPLEAVVVVEVLVEVLVMQYVK